MSSSETALQKFNEQGMALMANLADTLKVKKEIEAKEKSFKSELLGLMEDFGVKSIDNEYVRITYIEGSESVGIDMKAFEKAEADVYKGLLEDYPKVTKRSASIRITVK